jgi:hypothetical protein
MSWPVVIGQRFARLEPADRDEQVVQAVTASSNRLGGCRAFRSQIRSQHTCAAVLALAEAAMASVLLSF